MNQFIFKTPSLRANTVCVAISFLLLLITSQNLFAQGTSEGTIHGKIIDNDSKRPIPRATVTVNNPTTNHQIAGGFTDREGNFRININPGIYNIRISFLGYEPHKIQNVTISRNNMNHNIGTISLKQSSIMTQEVRVEAQREAIEIGLDRKIFNIEQDVKNLGGSAIDVLANIPSITVDEHDNSIAMRGNSNVKIMIDGRLSALSAAEALEQIPATMISSIELITNPGARFDAEGTGGIINVVTTRQRDDGVNAMVNWNAGTDDAHLLKLNGSVNINWNVGKWNIFTNFSGRHGNRTGTGMERWTLWDTNGVPSYMNEDDSLKFGQRFMSGKIGADYNITPNDVITYSLHTQQSKWMRDAWYEYSFMDADRNITDRYDRNVDNSSNNAWWLNTVNALSYKRTFAQRGHELFADMFFHTWDASGGHTSFEQFYYTPESNFTVPDENKSLERNAPNTFIRILVGQIDYTVPIGRNLKIETGGKFTNVLRKFNNQFDTSNTVLDGLWLGDTNRSDDFRFTQQIFAGYATASSAFGKLKYNLGLRSETTVTGFDSYRIDSSFTSNYTRLFPSVYFAYEHNPHHQFNLSFSTRIRRPDFRDVNPMTDYSKPLSLSRGNPVVKPEYSYAGEAGYMLNYENTTLTATLFYRHTTDDIERFRQVLNGDTTVIMPMNIKCHIRTGFEFIGMQKINNWWKIDGNFTFYENTMDATNLEEGEKHSTNHWTVRLNSVKSLNKDLESQLSYNYRSKMRRTQAVWSSTWNLDASFRYNINRQLSLNMRIQDIFNSRQTEEIEHIPEVFHNFHKHHWYNRAYFIGMTYRFQDFRQRRDRSSDDDNGIE